MLQFDFWISPKVIRVSSRYLWSIYTNIISFCWHNFHGRNFDTRRNFDDKPTIEGFKKGLKLTIEVEKSDFLAISRVIRLISWKRVKMIHKHIFQFVDHENRPNRPIYQKLKIWIFWPFLAHFLLINSA